MNMRIEFSLLRTGSSDEFCEHDDEPSASIEAGEIVKHLNDYEQDNSILWTSFLSCPFNQIK
jgi:hypothetical protein